MDPNLKRYYIEEVLHLHSLWHIGPPRSPNPRPTLRPTFCTAFKKESKNKKKSRSKWERKKQQQRQQQGSAAASEQSPTNPPAKEVEWPCGPMLEKNDAPANWADLAPMPVATQTRPPSFIENQARVAADRAQQRGLKACKDFFSKKDGSDGREENSKDEDEAAREGDFKFFLGLFESDGDLREYYEKNWEKGDFSCLVCRAIGVKKCKRFGDCIGLIQHSNSISKMKRREAHQAFTRAMCRVLGWDINRLPSIVLDSSNSPRQSLAKAANPQKNLWKESKIDEKETDKEPMDCTETKRIMELPNEDMQKDLPTEVEEISNEVAAYAGTDKVDLIDYGVKEIEALPSDNLWKEGEIDEKETDKEPMDCTEIKRIMELPNVYHALPNRNPTLQSASCTASEQPPTNSPVKEVEWPCDLVPEKNDAPTSWADLAPMLVATQTRPPSFIENQARATTDQAQQRSLKACKDFFSKKVSSDDREEEDSMDEDKVAGEGDFKFFLGLFESDGDLREYYKKNWEKGDVSCLVCRAIGVKRWKRFRNCVRLIQHSNSISKKKRREAHQAFVRAMCRVLDWDINRLPSIVLDTGNSSGQSLAKATNPQFDDEDMQKDLSAEVGEISNEVAAYAGTDKMDLIDCAAKEIKALPGENLWKESKIDEKETNKEIMDCTETKRIIKLPNVYHAPPNPNPTLRPASCTAFKKEAKNKNKSKSKWKKKKQQQRQQQGFAAASKQPPTNLPAKEVEWSCGPMPEKNDALASWTGLAPMLATAQTQPPSSIENQARAAADRAQQGGLKVCKDFFSKKDGSDDREEEEDSTDEDEAAVEGDFKFFLGLFESDGDLREYYEKNWEKGDFNCLVCGAIGIKKWKRFGDCIRLIQHSNSISKMKRREAHRAFVRAVCRVLSWDINRLPSIILNSGNFPGQSLAKAVNPQEDMQKNLSTKVKEISNEVVAYAGTDKVDLMDCAAKEIKTLPNENLQEECEIDEKEIDKELIDCTEIKRITELPNEDMQKDLSAKVEEISNIEVATYAGTDKVDLIDSAAKEIEALPSKNLRKEGEIDEKKTDNEPMDCTEIKRITELSNEDVIDQNEKLPREIGNDGETNDGTS